MVENNPTSFHGVMVARAVACPSDGLIPIRVINHCQLRSFNRTAYRLYQLLEIRY